MSDVDLIPVAWRERRAVSRWMRAAGIALACVVLAVAGARLLVHHRVEEQKQALAERALAERALELQHQQLAELAGAEAALRSQMALLEVLRRGFPADRVFAAVDRALDPRIRFLDWEFRRAGEVVEADAPEAVSTGYFVVLPQRPGDGRPRAWQSDTHMELRAVAPSHEALAAFVKRLSGQPEIRTVRILNTQVRTYTDREVVGFELVVSFGEPGTVARRAPAREVTA